MGERLFHRDHDARHLCEFLAELLDAPEFVSGDYDTGIITRMRAR